MGYSEEQTRAYNSLIYSFEVFDDMKKKISKEKCPVHKKKLKMQGNWEHEYDLNVIISNYCCQEFAIEIANKFIEEGSFTHVYLEPPITK